MTTAAVEVVTRPDLLTAAPTADVVALQRQFAEMCSALLDDSDYQRIGNRQFKTKSAWRKLAAGFNVSDDLLEKTYTYRDDGRILRAEYVVKATAPNGRSTIGVGIAPIYERTFSNPEHDIPGTAHTRAKNRAFSDLFGLGEVSAEEMRNENDTDRDYQRDVARRTDAAPARLVIDGEAGTGSAPTGLDVGGPQRAQIMAKGPRSARPPVNKAAVMSMVGEVSAIEAAAALENDTYNDTNEAGDRTVDADPRATSDPA